MLQTADLDEDMQEEGQSNLLQPAYYWELVKRRALFIAVPFLLIASGGLAVAMLWPPTYLSEGKILVQSQEIPTELVRPTVTSGAQERIQVIEQRTMTRENLLAIIDKFKLFPEQRNLMSATQLVELMKKRTSIAPVAQPLAFSRRTDNPTIVFTVGFEDSDPTTASRVANELVTRILNEDLRDRTSRATETTKFLGREVQKLQADNAAIEARLAEAKATQLKPNSNGSDPISQLKAEYAQKAAIYSEKHPLMKALKRQLEAAEKLVSPNGGGGGVDLDALQTQLEASQKNLDAATAKYQAAQLGEALEKNQQSEKLEVIEQPTVPQEPVKPNRPKIIGMSLLLGLAAGGSLTLLLEMLDSTIRRSSDLYRLVESHIVVTVPYIVTQGELLRSQRMRRLLTLAIVPTLVVLLVCVYFLMPPIDLIIAKARVGLVR